MKPASRNEWQQEEPTPMKGRTTRIYTTCENWHLETLDEGLSTTRIYTTISSITKLRFQALRKEWEQNQPSFLLERGKPLHKAENWHSTSS